MQFLNAMLDTTVEKIKNTKASKFEHYRFDPIGYVQNVHNGNPWKGIDKEHPGQWEILEDYGLCLKQQWERQQYELNPDFELTVYEPGMKIQNWFRIAAGVGTGKTKLSSWIIQHFFDCFPTSITYCYAPVIRQINDLVFREIRNDRVGRDDLPGRVLKQARMTTDDGNHFVTGIATANQQTEAYQGLHAPFQLFTSDEAEGLPRSLWPTIKAMTTGGISVVLFTANPRTRTSEFHKCADLPYVRSYRLSCLWFPNVYYGKTIVPDATERIYVDDLIDDGCKVVTEHDPDKYTFEVHWRPGRIYMPTKGEFLWRVMGIAPSETSNDTAIAHGRFQGAIDRNSEPSGTIAQIGIDAARYGDDKGTIYCQHGDYVWLYDQIERQDGYEYYISVLRLIHELHKKGVKELYVRVDGGGGYGSTVIDSLSHNDDLYTMFDEFVVSEVHFNGVPYDTERFADRVTEMYFAAGEVLQRLTIGDYAPSLQDDLCSRRYKNVTKSGKDVKKLRSKEEFKAEFKRSPDHGDGFALAVAPQFIFVSLSGLGFG